MLDITAISKTFHPGTPNARQALRQLSLHLEDGEFATIVGSNGAGKSTLFGAIAGSFYTDEGRILLDGTDLTFQPEHRRSRVIGRLFQDPMRGTAPHMTIEENLALAYLRASHGRSPYPCGRCGRRWRWGRSRREGRPAPDSPRWSCWGPSP